MNKSNLTRRQFLATASTTGIAAIASGGIPAYADISRAKKQPNLAILGGQPVRTKPFPAWPVWDETDEELIVPVLRGGVWSRDKMVSAAEKKFAELMGSKYCLATTNGTQALITALYALGIGGGDEVITTPYTFVATVDAVLLANALPIFVDIDPRFLIGD